jgi:hypothetical protein
VNGICTTEFLLCSEYSVNISKSLNSLKADVAELVDARDLKYVLSFVFVNKIRPALALKPIENDQKVVVLHNGF